MYDRLAMSPSDDDGQTETVVRTRSDDSTRDATFTLSVTDGPEKGQRLVFDASMSRVLISNT